MAFDDEIDAAAQPDADFLSQIDAAAPKDEAEDFAKQIDSVAPKKESFLSQIDTAGANAIVDIGNAFDRFILSKDRNFSKSHKLPWMGIQPYYEGNPGLAASMIGRAIPVLASGPLAPLVMGAESAGAEGTRSKAEGDTQEIQDAKSTLGFATGAASAFLPTKLVPKGLGLIPRTAIGGASGAVIGAGASAGQDLAQGRPIDAKVALINAGVSSIIGSTGAAFNGQPKASRLPEKTSGVVMEGKVPATIGEAERTVLQSLKEIPTPKPRELPQSEAPAAAQSVSNSNVVPPAPEVPSINWKKTMNWGNGIFKRTLSEMDNLVDASEESVAVPKVVGEFTPFKQVINKAHGAMEVSNMALTELAQEIKRLAPDKMDREAITNWREAGGSTDTLKAWAAATKNKDTKAAYLRATELSPEQIHLAEAITQQYGEWGKIGQDAGILGDLRENYANHIIDKPSSGWFHSKFKKSMNASKERVHDTFFDGEQAGTKYKTKDAGELLVLYGNEMNKVKTTLSMLDALRKEKASDGRPLAVIAGNGKLADGVEGGTIIPFARPEIAKDFVPIDNASFRGAKWIGTHEGKPVFIQGQMLVHPEVATHMQNIVGSSKIKTWYNAPSNSGIEAFAKTFVKGVDATNANIKGSMLGGVSPFHLIHEVKRSAADRINPFDLPKVESTNPRVKFWTEHSLTLHEGSASNVFQEGLTGGGIINKLPLLGPVSKQMAEFTFGKEGYIPRVKLKLADVLYERNLKLYADEIKAGDMKKGDVAYLTAKQVNNHIGGMNLADIGRSPTLQHILRLTTLAPDFWEANLRHYGAVAQGLTTSKTGRQPVYAFLTTSAAAYVASRVLNMALDGDPHPEEPFGVIHNGRVYTMRNEAEDLWRMVNNPRGYVQGRVSPIVGTLADAYKGTNWRGEKVTPMEIVKDFILKPVPMSLRGVPGIRDLRNMLSSERSTLSPGEEMTSSAGVQIARRSPINDAYKLADNFKRTRLNEEANRGTFEPSPYRFLKAYLEDGNLEAARKEVRSLVRDQKIPPQILMRSVKQSIYRPWTGSSAKDEAFMKSLNREDYKKILKANATRDAMWRRFEIITQQ